MLDRYDPRDDGPQDARDGGRAIDRGGRGGGDAPDRQDRDPRDVFTRDLDLPRGRDREHVRDRDRVYDLDGSEARMLATVGSFRVVAEHDLHALRDDARKPHHSLRHLEDEGLIRRSPLNANDRAVVLTDRDGICSRPIERSHATSAPTSPARPSTRVSGSLVS